MTYVPYGQYVGDILESFNHETNHGTGGYSNFSASTSGSLIDQNTWNSYYSDFKSY